jgi:hypothetical protein
METSKLIALKLTQRMNLKQKKLCIFYASSYATFDKESFMNFADGLTFDEIEDFSFPGLSFSENDFLEDTENDDEIPETEQNELGVELGIFIR